MRVVTCQACKHFAEGWPYPKQSLGLCNVLTAFEDEYKRQGKRMPPTAYDDARRRLGGKIFWPMVERQCEKYAPRLAEV